MFEDDLTAAWYAAAPPPPPAPAKGTGYHDKVAARASYAGPPSSRYVTQTDTGHRSGSGNGGMRTSSSSMSLSFDKRALGDDLPADSHAPEPERPVSRNAMARQRERERQRARTNSSVGYHDTAGDQQQHYLHAASMSQAMRSPSPGPNAHARRDSSPAAAGYWSTYGDQQAPPSVLAGHYGAQTPHQIPTQTQPYPNPATGQAVYPVAPPVAVAQSPHPSPVWPTYSTTSASSPHPTYAQPHAQTSAMPNGTPVAVPYYTPQPVQHGAYNFPGPVSAPQTPSGFSHFAGAYTAEPLPMASQQAPLPPATWSQVGYPAPLHAISPVPTPSAVPFPSSSMPPPVAPAHYSTPPPHAIAFTPAVYGTPPQQHTTRPLPAPSSRSSSQSSSVGTRASTTSLGSASGSVRRSLPQPPGAMQQHRSDSGPAAPVRAAEASGINYATVRPSDVPASLGRHESVRMAAEELMARGAPRRKPLHGNLSRAVAHANASRSDGSITDGTIPGVVNRPLPPITATPRGRAESGGCLEKEMRAMKLNNDASPDAYPAQRMPLGAVQPTSNGDHGVRTHVPVPVPPVTCTPARASSPRPIRAAPAPAPEVTIASPIEEIIPRRPVSRGPKDERERRRSMEVAAVAAAAATASGSTSTAMDSRLSFNVPQIRSPPPDSKPPVPTISFDTTYDAVISPGVPSIVLPGEIEEERGDSRQAEMVGPSIQVAGPDICVSSSDSDVMDKPTGTISISVSATNLAQRSTTTTSNGNGNGNGLNEQRLPSTSTMGRMRGSFAAPEPASAPSVGSGAACATCQKWISGRVVHAMSHTFHPDCFACFHCGEHLEHVAFYEHEGRPYCHFDFHELFSKRCFHCRTPIVDQRYITINDKELIGNSGGGEEEEQMTEERCYHETHFFCANCGDPFLDPKLAASAAGADTDFSTQIADENGTVTFGGREFVVHKGYPYCEKCHVNLHKPRCKGCKRPIVDEDYLTALRAKWHVGCFCCERCKHPIDSDNFFVRDGQAYDEQCYKIKLRSEL